MVLARGDGERELVRPVVAVGCGAEVADGALLTTSVELEEVVGTGAKAGRPRRAPSGPAPASPTPCLSPPRGACVSSRATRQPPGSSPGRARSGRPARVPGGSTGRCPRVGSPEATPSVNGLRGEAGRRLERAARHQRHGHRRAGAPPRVLQEAAAVDRRCHREWSPHHPSLTPADPPGSRMAVTSR